MWRADALAQDLVELLNHMDGATRSSYSGSQGRTPLRAPFTEWLAFLVADAHVLRQRPTLLLQQAHHQPDDSAPARAAAARTETRGFTRPWLRWLNKRRSLCLTTLPGHPGDITACALTPDGERLYSSAADGTTRTWDLTRGVELAVMDRTAHAMSPMGLRAAAFSEDAGGATAIVWDLETGATIARLAVPTLLQDPQGVPLPDPYRVPPYVFSPDGTLLAVAGIDGKSTLIDVGRGTVRSEVPGRALAISPDGSQVLCLREWATLVLLRLDRGAELGRLEATAGKPRVATFAPDGNRVFVGTSVGTVLAWNPASERATPLSSPEAVVVVGEGNRTVRVRELGGGLQAREREPLSRTPLPSHREAVTVCRLSPDGTVLISAAQDGTIKLWDCPSGAWRATLAGHLHWVRACASTAAGKLLASGSADGLLKLWNGEAAIAAKAEQQDVVDACRYFLDGSRVASRAFNHLTVWDSTTGERLASHSHTSRVTDVALQASGLMLAAYLDGKVKLWDPVAERMVREVTAGSPSSVEHRFVRACAVSPDGGRTVFADDAGRTVLVDQRGGEVVQLGSKGKRRTPGQSEGLRWSMVRFSPDGERILTATRETSRMALWHGRSGAELLTFRAPGGGVEDCGFAPDGESLFVVTRTGIHLLDQRTGNAVSRIPSEGFIGGALSPDGNLAAAALRGGRLMVWDRATGELLLEDYSGAEGSVAWSPDGKRLALGAIDGGIRLLQLENLPIGRPAVTAWRRPERWWVRLFGARGAPAACCPGCGRWFRVPASTLGGPHACPGCGVPLQINALTVDGDWKRTATALERGAKRR